MPSSTSGSAPVRGSTRVCTNVAVIAIAAVMSRNATPVFSGEKPRNSLHVEREEQEHAEQSGD
jgi:hypothetical protein